MTEQIIFDDLDPFAPAPTVPSKPADIGKGDRVAYWNGPILLHGRVIRVYERRSRFVGVTPMARVKWDDGHMSSVPAGELFGEAGANYLEYEAALDREAEGPAADWEDE